MAINTHFQEVQKIVQEKASACGRSLQEISIIFVSKYCSLESMESAYREGCTMFGESRLQEALPKIHNFQHRCQWHFIGPLQRNKVAKVITFFNLIHSVDSLELAQKIAVESERQNIRTSILLQVNTSGEKTKQGLSPSEWENQLSQLNAMPNLSIEGLMTIAPFTQDSAVIRACFSTLSQCRKQWKPLMNNPDVFKHLSMGMSNDFLIAIEEGATLLRIGSAICPPTG
jgi:pyridoxal phosphate enzyme (YggS family)